MIKAVLLLGGKKYDITDDLKNWEDVEISMKRKDFGGVFRTFSNKFEFVGNAYILLENEYLTNYLNSSAVIVIGVLNNLWTYNEKIRCQIDFSTYQSDGSTISVNGIDNSIEAIVNANKSQVYDIPVSELKVNQLYYDRMDLKNSCDFYVIPNIEQDKEDEYKIYFKGHLVQIHQNFPLGYGTVNFPVKNKIDVGDINISSDPNTDYLVKTLNDINVIFKINFDVYIEMESGKNTLYMTLLRIFTNNEGKLDETSIDDIRLKNKATTIIDKEYNIMLKQGDKLIIRLYQKENNDTSLDVFLENVTATITNVKNVSVSYIAKNESVYIDAFTPDRLLSSLLANMGLKDVVGLIEPGELPIPYMLAAESIRNIPNAKVHTSFNKFVEWAKACLGYSYNIKDNNIIFKHMTKLYDQEEILNLDYVNSLDFSIDSSVIYSGVEVGYEKKDYDEINGRDEFHVKNSFSTGLAINDNVYKLISPYRADCYGIEFLAQKRDEDTKDDSSDNDLFIVDAKIQRPRAQLVLSKYGYNSGVLFPDSVFNIMYSPKRMLLANKEYLSICTKNLTFTASEGNADAILDGIGEKETITLEDHFFRVEKINVETTGLFPFPSFYEGLIRFVYNNHIYEGYISDITEKIGKAQTTNYNLICKNVY